MKSLPSLKGGFFIGVDATLTGPLRRVSTGTPFKLD
jgi:hypothetical protein